LIDLDPGRGNRPFDEQRIHRNRLEADAADGRCHG